MRTHDFRLTERQVAARELLRQKAGKRHVLLRGGSRSGKTFVIVRHIVNRCIRADESRHCIFRLHGNAVKASIWEQTFPDVMRKCFPSVGWEPHRQSGYIQLPNGSQIWMGGLSDKDRVDKILGQEFATLYFNEVSEIPYSSILVALTRLAQVAEPLMQQALYDCNPPPRSHWTYKMFRQGIDPGTGDALYDPSDYAEMRMNPSDNLQNLDPAYIKSLEHLPERAKKRFWEGEWGADNPFALWKLDQLNADRIPVIVTEARLGSEIEVRKAIMLQREMRRVVVSVDPPISSGENADECGILVTGRDAAGRGYVIDDFTVQGMQPNEWAKEVHRAFRLYDADLVVAEVNQGGEMVKSVLRQAFPSLPYKAVHATRGKVVRAEPVSALYGEHRCHHLGTFEVLEQQMTDFTSDFDRKAMGYSPDRVDALVWGFTELFDFGAPIDLGSGVVLPDAPMPTSGWDL